MLTEFLIRDETICSLGTTEHTFTVHHLGTTIKLSVWLDPQGRRNRFSSGDLRVVSQFVPLASG
jgi:hypothetical protein